MKNDFENTNEAYADFDEFIVTTDKPPFIASKNNSSPILDKL